MESYADEFEAHAGEEVDGVVITSAVPFLLEIKFGMEVGNGRMHSCIHSIFILWLIELSI